MKIKCSRKLFLSKSGFTLIELLVVVLIIGVLAAVALPQYNKAVKKAQMTEVYTAVDALDKALGAYYAENGNYATLVDRGDGFPAVHAEDLSFEIPKLAHFAYGYGGSHEFQVGSNISNDGNYLVVIRSDTNPVLSFGFKWEKGLLEYRDCIPLENCKSWVNCTEVQVGTATVCYF